jgi:ComF family protein
MIDSLLELLSPHICKGCSKSGSILCNCCKINILDNKFTFCVTCGIYLTTKETEENGNQCKKCARSLPFTKIYIVGWRTDTLKKLVGDFKYNSEYGAAKTIAELLYESLPQLDKDVIITPIPTSATHIRRRGFDHMALIAKQLAKLTNHKTHKLLWRETNVSQHEQSAVERRRLAAKMFSYNPRIEVPEKVLLIDDIWTTGATVTAAARLLKNAGVKEIQLGIIARHSRNAQT